MITVLSIFMLIAYLFFMGYLVARILDKKSNKPFKKIV